MHFSNFNDTLMWVQAHGYPYMLLAMIIEGPVITAAATFAVAFGYFSLPVIFILSILGDLIADFAFFAVGYLGRQSVVEKYGHYFGLTLERTKRLEKLLIDHGAKTMVAIKLNPLTPIPGLMLIGAGRMPLRKYIIISLAVTIPKTILFMLLGFYFGKTYDSLAQHFHAGAVALIPIAMLCIIAFFAFRYFTTRIANKIEPL